MVRKTLLFLWCLFFLHQAMYSQSLENTLREHVTILSSDSMEGRGLGTKGSLLARDYIVRQFKEIGLKSFDEDLRQPFSFRMSLAQIHAENIVGYLPGNDSILKNEWIVVGAHYDHLGFESDDDTLVVYHGADDNASGVATLIELARFFSNNKTQLKRGVIFVAFDAEESGLRGSNHFVNHLPVPIHQIKAMFSCDMVGMVTKYKGVDLKGIEALEQGQQIADEVSASVGIHLKTTGYRFEQRTDTSPFGHKGIPSIHVFTGTVSPYHTPEDQSRLLDYQGMERVYQLMQGLVSRLSVEPQLQPSEKYLAYLQDELHKAESWVRWGAIVFTGEGHHVYRNQFYRANSVLCLGAGVYSHFRINDHFALQPELIYDYNGSIHPDGTLRRHSITVPVNVQFGTSDSPMDIPRLFVFAGGYFRYHFDARVGGRQISWDQDHEKQEWGFNFGAGLEFWRLQAGVCSRVALTPFAHENSVDLMPVNNLVFLGWRL